MLIRYWLVRDRARRPRYKEHRMSFEMSYRRVSYFVAEIRCSAGEIPCSSPEQGIHI